MKNRLLIMLLSIVTLLLLLPCAALAVSVSTQAELEAAIANAGSDATHITLSAGTYTLPGSIAGKSIVFEGESGVIFDMSSGIGANDSSLTFISVTLEFGGKSEYKGFYHAKEEVYKHCTILGQQFLYAPVAEFTNCTFENKDAYCVWTYGAKDVSFDNCVFETGGKAILVYNEQMNFEADIALKDCDFYSDGSLASDKAAVETGVLVDKDGNIISNNKYNLNFEDCVAVGFSENNSPSPLWGNKNNINTENLDIEVATPTTGDSSQPMLWAAMLAFSAMAMMMFARKSKEQAY